MLKITGASLSCLKIPGNRSPRIPIFSVLGIWLLLSCSPTRRRSQGLKIHLGQFNLCALILTSLTESVRCSRSHANLRSESRLTIRHRRKENDRYTNSLFRFAKPMVMGRTRFNTSHACANVSKSSSITH